jgi:hypothetical protein
MVDQQELQCFGDPGLGNTTTGKYKQSANSSKTVQAPITYSVLVNVHVYSVEATGSALAKLIPFVDTDEPFEDGNVGTIAFSVPGNVSNHIVSLNITAEDVVRNRRADTCRRELTIRPTDSDR